jgi:hypothetical protein
MFRIKYSIDECTTLASKQYVSTGYSPEAVA